MYFIFFALFENDNDKIQKVFDLVAETAKCQRIDDVNSNTVTKNLIKLRIT